MNGIALSLACAFERHDDCDPNVSSQCDCKCHTDAIVQAGGPDPQEAMVQHSRANRDSNKDHTHNTTKETR